MTTSGTKRMNNDQARPLVSSMLLPKRNARNPVNRKPINPGGEPYR
jgi:hypothetical protein